MKLKVVGYKHNFLLFSLNFFRFFKLATVNLFIHTEYINMIYFILLLFRK
jgi:hypothetical protein